jgi:hypothetical protein
LRASLKYCHKHYCPCCCPPRRPVPSEVSEDAVPERPTMWDYDPEAYDDD